jgi:hypothetical protein
MDSIYSIHTELTAKTIVPNPNINLKVFDFAKLLGWNPSYFLPADMDSETFANGYLSVEHGLENTAVLAFLNKPYNDLNTEERKKLDSIAFNNLVSWIIPIDKHNFSYIYILNSQKRIVEESKIYPENLENLRSEKFLQVIGKKPNPNILALDDSLIETISYWKRYISGELESLNNEVLSALFNSIIFVRAIEDNNKRYKQSKTENQLLLKTYDELKGSDLFSISEILKVTLTKLAQTDLNSELIDFTQLQFFNNLDKYVVYNLLIQFYETDNNKFSYDFSIMTKHALSRIYERYVSVLNFEDTQQLALFNRIPVERNVNKFSGTYYTPEYIARFFAKYLLKEITINQFNSLKICEPAVGSGMFLRTLLEVLYENIHPDYDRIDKQIFKNIIGLDVDPNACQATKLSLSLLHLLIYDEIPKKLNIVNSESIEYLTKGEMNSYDIVVSNPPFVRYENTDSEYIKEYLGDLAVGKTDLYLAFLKLSIDILKPNGYGLFVLPHSFMVNNSASKIRKLIYEKTNVTLIADLSAIPVFEDISTYVILLIFQKKDENLDKYVLPKKIRCKNFVGRALEETLNNIQTSNENYSIYLGQESDFAKNEWFVLPPGEYTIEQKFKTFPTIENFLKISSGIITGADNIFIFNKSNIPKGEEAVYKQFLSDRKITSYKIVGDIDEYIFYPFENGIHLTASEVEHRFPKTWKFLLSHKDKLETRKSMPKEWWMLRSPSAPDKILIPKIVNPELTITPKFSFDIEGKFVVSHSSYLSLKTSEYDNELLYYFLGILNSTPCYWYISTHSNKYGSGYNKIQPKTLKNTPIPDPFSINKRDLLKLIKLVKERLNQNEEKILQIEKDIDLLVCNMYGLTNEESNILLGG